MLIFDKFLLLLKKSLVISCAIVLALVIYMKFFMYNISTEIVSIEKKIEELKSSKHMLNIELTYLLSTERLLAIVEKNPNIIADREIIKSTQVKTKDEFRRIAFAKLKDNPIGLNDVAKNEIFNNKIR